MPGNFRQGHNRGPDQPRQQSSDRTTGRSNNLVVHFDPQKPEHLLFDELAEQQADSFEYKKLSSNQLRRFFGEVKELYRLLEARCAGHEGDDQKLQQQYEIQIAPRFKMIRSKVFYAEKQNSNRIPSDFANFLKTSISKVNSANDFRKFVMHFEAVVGFMYGKDKVS